MKLLIKDPKEAMKALGSNIERKAGTHIQTADGMAQSLAIKYPEAFTLEGGPKTKAPTKNKMEYKRPWTKTKKLKNLKSE